MILSKIRQIKRVNGVFYVDNLEIKADRIASNGFGVLCIFEPSKLDYDFRAVLGSNRFAWFPTAEDLSEIGKQLDISDYLTRDWFRNGKGWKGIRPFNEKVKG